MKLDIIKAFGLSLIFLLSMSELQAQFLGLGKKDGKRSSKSSPSGEIPQFQFGLKGGINLNHLESIESHSVITPVDLGTLLTNQKVYDKPYSNIGTQIGLSAAFALNHQLVLSVEPTFMTLKFGYQTAYSWSQGEDSFVNTDNDFDHALNYLDLPVMVKYHFTTGQIKPFVQAGGYYAFLTNANKTVTTTIEDSALGGSGDLTTSSQRLGVNDLFITSNAGIVGGAGVSIDVGGSPGLDGNSDLGTVRFSLSVNYRQGLHNVVDVKNRYQDSELVSGNYDVLDDLKFKNIEVSISCLFTMKYSSK